MHSCHGEHGRATQTRRWCGCGVFRSMRRGRSFAACLSLAAALLLAGCTTTRAPRVALDSVPTEQRERAGENLRIFGRVWSLVADAHYDPKFHGLDWLALGARYGPEAARAADDTALYTTLNTMLAPLKDSHTHAFSPERVQERRTQTRALTGLTLARLESRWIVSEVLSGGPAELGGVKPGWVVTARNGAPLGDFRFPPPRAGEVVRWEFLDAMDKPVALALAAKVLSTKPQPVSRVLTEGIVYLRFDAFAFRDRRWLSAQLKAHREAPGVVIDLRWNPGGSTISLGIVIGEFFDRAVECGTFITRGGRRADKSSWQLGSARYAGRVAVLVDVSTGSAAEIFSAVLQEHGRATVIGRRTAGAVLASWFHGLPGGGELQLSREDYVTPHGRRVEGAGVEPDLKVVPRLAELRAGRDVDLEAALHLLGGAK